MSNYIEHHGILGMRWGVRRYVNKDGTLTQAGKRRYEAIANKYKVKEAKEEDRQRTNVSIQKAGIVMGNDYDEIPKGVKFQRISNDDESVDSRPKYVTVTEQDNSDYRDMGISGYFSPDGIPSKYVLEYESIKNLKVANGRAVTEYIIDKYGDTSVKNAYELFGKRGGGDEYYIPFGSISKTDKKIVQAFNKPIKEGTDEVYKLLKDTMFSNKKTQSKIIDHFAKRGYDAIVDAEDAFTSVAEYPLILLDPKRSVRRSLDPKRSVRRL